MMDRRALLLLLLLCARARPQRREPSLLLDNLHRGMQIAKDFLGSESVALKVAEFVVKAFQANSRDGGGRPERGDAHHSASSVDEERQDSRPYASGNEDENALNPLKHLVKLFGLQPTQLSAVAVNALLFVAQMISTFLAGPKRRGKPQLADDPLAWILNKRSKSLQDLIEEAKNESLPDAIQEMLNDSSTGEETSCIKLLICKITPFVSKMQRAVFGENVADSKRSGVSVMYRHLPTKEEINEQSDICEYKHKECDLNAD